MKHTVILQMGFLYLKEIVELDISPILRKI
ncbi:hypothetical protein vBEcoMWL3_gp221c [Escherichia phage vB_EcoM_WL-3]|nr:hypothetical protein vBEcoMWL3_gp221c [Escherichia phage vB_EcoM_WL-3]